MVCAIKEMAHSRRHVQSAFFLCFRRLKQAKLYLGIIVAHVLEMALHLGLLQERSCACLDGQCWHGDDKLIYAATLVQLKHRPGVDVGLARARLHLYVEQTMVWQTVNLVCEHVVGNPLLCGFVQDICFFAHSHQRSAAELIFQQRILVARLWRFLY